MSDEITFTDFQQYFSYAPTALSIKECVRLRRMRQLDCPSPILDLGCGDGLFAKLAFPDAAVWGIDIDGDEGRRAQASRVYAQVILADVTRAHLPESFFASCVANCSLEHIPAIDQALRTVQRSLRPGGRIYAFVPNRDWTRHLLSVRLFHRLGLTPVSEALREAIDGVFKHHHLEDADGWARIFRAADLEVLAVDPIGSTASTVAFEAFLLPSAVALANKHITGRWTLWPGLRKVAAAPVYAIVRAILAAAPDRQPTAEFLVTARRPE